MVAPTIGVDSGGQPGHAPPIIKMGAKPLFCPPNNQTRIFIFFYLKKKMKKAETETKKENTKKREQILNEGYNFLKKSCRGLKKVIRNFYNRIFKQNFLEW